MPELGQRGFSLIEAMAAIMIIGTSVVGSMALLSATVNSASRSEGNVKLLQLVRSQIENMKHFEYQDDPSGYPLITGLPEGVAVTFEVEDSGISYTRPQPDGS
ncbi:MAG: prepilin-type N-terminal cleavage/methylation domain-containing protein, partial [Chloroflexi bacterium]|nr:prepilin-type N-terminal cleavage/methylation domain-containing protein [Chloroflexota bacterium]